MVEPGTILSALVGTVTLLALVMTVLAGLAYRRERRARFLLLAAAFGVLFARSLFVASGLFMGADWETMLGASAVSDVLLLALLYIAAAR